MDDVAQGTHWVRFRHLNGAMYLREHYLKLLGRVITEAYANGARPPEKFWRLHAVTTCEIMQDDMVVAVGYSFCSGKDQFGKKKGRMISEARATKRLCVS